MKLNQPVSFDTDSVILTTREWKHAQGKGEFEDQLKGYALRLYHPESRELIQEKYQPPSVEKDIQWVRENEDASSGELERTLRDMFQRPKRERQRSAPGPAAR